MGLKTGVLHAVTGSISGSVLGVLHLGQSASMTAGKCLGACALPRCVLVQHIPQAPVSLDALHA